MALWELLNPSDPITFEGDDFEAVAHAVMLLGQGRYPARELRAKEPREVPLFLFESPDAWFVETFEKTLEQSMEGQEDFLAVADVLDSVQVCKETDRFEYQAKWNTGLIQSERDRIRKEWCDEHRSSMNNLCDQAWHIAREIRKGMDEEADDVSAANG